MAGDQFEEWLKHHHPRFGNLTTAVIAITNSLLAEAGIPYLSVTGRTKGKSGCLEKAKRKGYKRPNEEMTDISGIRIIFFFEHDVLLASRLISNSFRVDTKNSKNRDELLSTNEVGYRSVHLVCDLGEDRAKLPEFRFIGNLKFEFQIRTVLQHAWAELAHDRNYKFSGNLPKPLERKLFLLAGHLEFADAGFSELSNQIDSYIKNVSASTSAGILDIELNSLSLQEFVSGWARDNKIKLAKEQHADGFSELIRELKDFGIQNLQQLKEIIPDGYQEIIKDDHNNIYGAVRDWMMIYDTHRFLRDVRVNWVIDEDESEELKALLSKEDFAALVRVVGSDSIDYDDASTFSEDDPSDYEDMR